ncbi:fimbrial biogenesis chaperone StbB [Tatumella punctata]
MQGNRVVFNASSESQTVSFINNDNFPYIVQTWTSVGENDSASDKSSGPFVLSPSVFKIPPHESQIVRMIYSQAGKKYNSERLYYLHFIQVPAVPTDLQNKNKLLLVINSTVKVFVRPDNLAVSHNDMFKLVTYRMSDMNGRCHFLITNNSPYILNAVEYKVSDTQGFHWSKIGMVAPGARDEFYNKCRKSNDQSPFLIKIINDYGVSQNITINRSE